MRRGSGVCSQGTKPVDRERHEYSPHLSGTASLALVGQPWDELSRGLAQLFGFAGVGAPTVARAEAPNFRIVLIIIGSCFVCGATAQ